LGVCDCRCTADEAGNQQPLAAQAHDILLTCMNEKGLW
jgi:hypothetical protein